MEMDLELGFIVVGVVAVTAIAVYFVSVMGIKEKSFEEAIAEQKKRSDDLLGRKEKKKVTVKEKTKKQKKAKEKEKQVTPIGDLSDEPAVTESFEKHVDKPEERHHVEIDPEPEIMEDPPAPESRRASVVKRRESIKSILINKEEQSPVVDVDVETSLNHFETSHPKDDLELKKQTSYEETPPPSPSPPLPPRLAKKPVVANSKKEDSSVSNDGQQQLVNNSGIYENVPNVTEDLIDAANSDSLKSARPGSPVTEKGNRGRKGKRVVEQDRDEPNANKLESTIERVSLSSSEIQKLIDILLNKQHAGDSEWINKGKNDNIGNLKKQLAENERQLSEERSTVQTLQLRLKELRQEFTNEKTNFAKSKKQLEDVNNQKGHDFQQLQLRLQQMRDGNLGEKQALQQQLQQMQMKLTQLREDNVAIKNALSIEQNNRGKAESLEREADALRTQCGHFENQLKASFQSNQDLTNQALGLQEHIRALEERKKQDEHNIHATYRAQFQERETHLLAELKKAQDVIAETEKDRTNLQQQITILQTSVRNSSETSKNLEDVTKKLEDTQKAEKNMKNLLEDAKSKLNDLQIQLSDKEVHLKELKDERESLAAQVVSLTERTAAEGQESEKINGDIRSHENPVASIDPAQLTELESRLEEKASLAQKLDTENINLKMQLDKASQDLKAQKDKNDELRLKNTKLMETLNVTERNLETRIVQSKELVQEERLKTRQEVENSLKETFQNLFPSVTIKDKADWVDDLARSIQEEIVQAKENIGAASSNSASCEEEKQLKEVNARLQEEVLHYQNVLSSTESLLSNLQGSIEKEERKWHLKLQQKESELHALKSSAPSASNADMNELKLQLEGEREEKSVLSQRCSELENNVQNLKKQIDQYESFTKNLDQLQVDLEEERKKSTDLLTENTNLKSLVTSGQVASTEDQERVKQLQDEITHLKSQLSTGTNGVANGKPIENSAVESIVVKGSAATTPTENPLASSSSSTNTSNPTNSDTPPKEKSKKKKLGKGHFRIIKGCFSQKVGKNSGKR